MQITIEELKKLPLWVNWKYQDRDGGKRTKVPVNVHINYGIYLRHESNAVKLSVFDKSKLNEIVWTKDVCDFSMGLFLPPELAWKGIKEFLKTGTASTEIEWISPNDIPEGGNY